MSFPKHGSNSKIYARTRVSVYTLVYNGMRHMNLTSSCYMCQLVLTVSGKALSRLERRLHPPQKANTIFSKLFHKDMFMNQFIPLFVASSKKTNS
jgi:hypothetical protein